MALGNLAQRFLVAVVAVPILLVILHYHRPEPTWALIFAASLLAMRELFGMMLPPDDRGPALVMGAVACAAFYWLDPIALATYHGLPDGAAAAVVRGQRDRRGARGRRARPLLPVPLPRHPRRSPAGSPAPITGIVYAGFLTTYLAKLKLIDPKHGGDTVVLVLLVAWLADTGGYFAGRFLGKTKLYEAVSPKKTWAGAYGGLAGSLVGVAVLKLAFATYLTWLDVFADRDPGRHPRPARRPRRVADQALGRREGLGRAAARPRRHPRPHRRGAVHRAVRLHVPDRARHPRLGTLSPLSTVAIQ